MERAEQAPRLVTLSGLRTGVRLTAVCMVVPAAVLFFGHSTGTLVVLVVLELCLWGAWWVVQGRFAHPIRELRWEREESRRGRPTWSAEHVSYKQAWERAGGDPGDDHAPATPGAKRD